MPVDRKALAAAWQPSKATAKPFGLDNAGALIASTVQAEEPAKAESFPVKRISVQARSMARMGKLPEMRFLSQGSNQCPAN